MILNGMETFNPGEGSWGSYAKRAYDYGHLGEVFKQQNQEELDMMKHRAKLHEYELMRQLKHAKAGAYEHRNDKISREADEMYEMQKRKGREAEGKILAIAEEVKQGKMDKGTAAKKIVGILGTTLKWGLKVGGAVAGFAVAAATAVASGGTAAVPGAIAGTKLGATLYAMGDAVEDTAPLIGTALNDWFKKQGETEKKRILNSLKAGEDMEVEKTKSEFRRQVKQAWQERHEAKAKARGKM
jgi:hypothetical protein